MFLVEVKLIWGHQRSNCDILCKVIILDTVGSMTALHAQHLDANVERWRPKVIWDHQLSNSELNIVIRVSQGRKYRYLK